MGEPRFGVVLLAAGGGRRMGRAKLILPWGGSGTVAGAALQAALAAPVAAVVAVTGADQEAVVGALRTAAATAPPEHEHPAPGPSQRPPRFQIVHNPEWEAGMARSLQVGLAALPPGLTGFFVALADMPLVPPAVYHRLVEAFQATPAIWVPTYQGRRGHPALFPVAFATAATRQQGDVGMRLVLREYSEQVRELPVPEPGVVVDLDTPDEYARYRPPEPSR